MQASDGIGICGRIYRAKWWTRIFALFFFFFSLAGCVHFWGNWLPGSAWPGMTEIVVPALLFLVGCSLVAHFFTTVVILFPNAIELQTVLSRRRMALDQIRGRRKYESTDSDGIKTRYIKLEPVDPRQRGLEFQTFYNFDSVFHQWLNQVPDLDH